MKDFIVKAEGPSGCGKSTFLNLVLAAFKHNGSVTIVKGKEHELRVKILREAFPGKENN